MDFVWSDGWILMAVHGAQRGGTASLSGIIGAADLLNHAIPTSKELNSTLTKFLQAGILSVDQDKFILSAGICSDIEAVRAKRGGLFGLPDKGLKLLAGLGETQQNEQVVDLSDEQVSRAHRKYSELIRQSGK